MKLLACMFVLAISSLGSCQYTKPQCQGNRQVVVHLFEWKWKDIANECEAYLGPKGFCAVQVSPPMEHVQGPEWWVRYQPVSYKLESRSGNREDFIDMVTRCGAVGVNIYVDAVINHMSGQDRSGVGTAGSNYDGQTQTYPDYNADNFHQPPCPVQSYTDHTQVRNCWLVGLTDLDGSQSYVRDNVAGYLNDLIDIGVAGFRVDAAKHMWPADIEAIQAKLKDVKTGGRPYFYHEVIDLSQSGEISVKEYYHLGQVTEFRYVIKIAEGVRNGFYGLQAIYDEGWGMSDYEHAFVFVDNHDNQRGHGGGGQVITHKDPRMYRFAQAFTLANDYGTKRIMSSYFFGDNSDQGPPSSSPGCGQDWVCEHRWKSVGQMVEFTNTVFGEPVEFKVAEHNTLALSRGNKGFFAMGDLSREFETGLPDGEYCDIISECQNKVQVSGGKAFIEAFDTNEPVVALCQGCTGNGGDFTTSRPQTTTGSTTVVHTTTTGSISTTTGAQGNCCEKVTLESTGGVQEHFHEALGTYKMDSIDANGNVVYKHETQLVAFYLHYTEDSEYNWSGWQFTKSINDVFGFISNENDDSCPSGAKNTPWRYNLNGSWREDDTVKVRCDEDGPTTASTTSKPQTTTTQNNGPTTTTSSRDKCDVSNTEKVDCGQMGTNEQQCVANGCCWEPVEPNPGNVPWCFHGNDYVDPCKEISWSWSGGPGFTDEMYNTMYKNYEANLNYQGSGAVVAAPDASTPGGSYIYHWMRDAGLSIKAWLDINNNDYNAVREVLEGYVKWVKIVQNKPDANNDVRIEPKFEIPSGDPYSGGWCRPQTDGPALRAMALSKWGNVLLANGQTDTAKSDIWPLIKYDMEWVLENWKQGGCDLWEEVRSEDFYFNRAGYVYSLNEAAKFADAIGESMGSQFTSKANEILQTLSGHYGKYGEFLYESDNRQQDGAVIHSIATFGEYTYGPESNEAASTIKTLTRTFCREYKINQDSISNGDPGVVIGRYPGDSYAGGNPWQLLTAVLAETFYLGAQATLNNIENDGVKDFYLNWGEHKEWIDLLETGNNGTRIVTAQDLARAQLEAGDAVMTRLYGYVKADNGKIDEQIDKFTGAQASAEHLTWSYANILHALHVRKEVAKTFVKLA